MFRQAAFCTKAAAFHRPVAEREGLSANRLPLRRLPENLGPGRGYVQAVGLLFGLCEDYRKKAAAVYG